MLFQSRIILSADATAAFDDITRDRRVETLSGQAPGDWPNSFRSSRLLSAVEYVRASRARTLLQRTMHDFMSQWDCIVAPYNSPLLVITNFTGHPQVCVPIGYIDGKSPVSLTFLGRLFEEGSPLRVAHGFQQATKWHEMNPPMNWVV